MPWIEGHLIDPDESSSEGGYAAEEALKNLPVALDIFPLSLHDPELRYPICVPQVSLQYCLELRQLDVFRLGEHRVHLVPNRS